MLLGGLWHGASWTFIVWGGLHGFGLAITRFFQRAKHQARLAAITATVAFTGLSVHWLALTDAGAWTQIMVAGLYLTPLWAVLTAWLGGDVPARAPTPVPTFFEAMRGSADVEIVRVAMVASGLAFFIALGWCESWVWIPLAVWTWLFGVTADLLERRMFSWRAIAMFLRRAVGVVLTFHYVCFAWIFFRAAADPDRDLTSFDNALAILRRFASLETDHPNVGPIVKTALAVGLLCHFFADGSYRWLRDRFVALPAWAQGCLLGALCLVLRALAPTGIVPFIYFQF
jgi:hypothetical protein